MDNRAAVVLVVDDEDKNLKLIDAMLKPEGHIILTASTGEEALEVVAQTSVDLVLLDVQMPGMDGFQVARKLKAHPNTKAIPIIMVTALDDRDSRLNALNMGAEDFLSKPVDRAELWVRVRNLLRLKYYSDTLETEVEMRTAELRESYRETIFTMTRAAEYRDNGTGTHIRRVSQYAKTLGEALGLPPEFIDALYYATPMHDVGKIGVPDYILLKPGALTEDEWRIMRSHTTYGAQILSSSRSPYVRMGAEIALTHHESYDGSGYPRGLSGETIPLAGRVMAICDVYDALRCKRPYKNAYEHATTVDIMLQGDGRTMPQHFDPLILDAFKECAEEFSQIYNDYEE